MQEAIQDRIQLNEQISSTWSSELSALDDQQLQLLKNIDASSRVYDQTVAEIKEIVQQFNSYQIESLSDEASYFSSRVQNFDDESEFEYESEIQTEETNATLNYLIMKRNQAAEELERMKQERRELMNAYLKRESSLKEEIRKKIAKLKEIKQAMLGGLVFETTSTESSGLMSLDGFSYTK